jgi:2-dehydropantoate 2-reductase
MNSLRVLVFGAGAIGTYVGGSLALEGHTAVFLERPDVAAELKQRGLRLDLGGDAGRSPAEPLVIAPSSFVGVSSLADALGHGPFDVAVFALKSFDTAAAIEMMKPHAAGLPPVLCLSNGVDNEVDLAAALGPERVIPGTVTSAIGRPAAGDIVLERRRGLGLWSGHPLSARLAAALGDAGLNVQLYASAADMKWSKLLTNLPANATAAILDMSAAEVYAHAGLVHLELAMLREALAVMPAHHIRVVDLPGTPVRLLALAARLPDAVARPLLAKAIGGGRGGKMPSFHIDLHGGRGKSEVGWLNGAVARYGARAGVAAPVNELLTETLTALTRGEVPLDTYARQPERLLALSRPRERG